MKKNKFLQEKILCEIISQDLLTSMIEFTKIGNDDQLWEDTH
jgi:hypothetical protein